MAEDAASHQPVSSKRPSRFFGIKIIKTRFQFKFAFVIFVFLFISAFLMWFQGKATIANIVNANMITDQEAISHLHLVNEIVLQTGVFAMAVVFGLSLFFSHFIAGPIYRFEKTLEEIINGNLIVPVKLRKHDEFKELATLFSQAMASLRVRLKKERDGVEGGLTKMAAVSEKLKNQGKSEEAAALDQAISEIRNTPPQIKI